MTEFTNTIIFMKLKYIIKCVHALSVNETPYTVYGFTNILKITSLVN